MVRIQSRLLVETTILIHIEKLNIKLLFKMKTVLPWKIISWSGFLLTGISSLWIYYATTSKLAPILVTVTVSLIVIISQIKIYFIEKSEIRPRLELLNNSTILKPGTNQFTIFIKNHGNAVAENIVMEVNYLTPKERQLMFKIGDLPETQEANFIIPMIPSIAFTGESIEERDQFIKEFQADEKAIALEFFIKYKKGKEKFNLPGYNLLYTFPNQVYVNKIRN